MAAMARRQPSDVVTFALLLAALLPVALARNPLPDNIYFADNDVIALLLSFHSLSPSLHSPRCFLFQLSLA
ncbi:unnamed protein product [Closterium sp. Naga37s-1]|nr:unnamed protein product [Closterium sp. Naga37s-1]